MFRSLLRVVPAAMIVAGLTAASHASFYVDCTYGAVVTERAAAPVTERGQDVLRVTLDIGKLAKSSGHAPDYCTRTPPAQGKTELPLRLRGTPDGQIQVADKIMVQYSWYTDFGPDRRRISSKSWTLIQAPPSP